jgi:hypothetical protein
MTLFRFGASTAVLIETSLYAKKSMKTWNRFPSMVSTVRKSPLRGADQTLDEGQPGHFHEMSFDNLVVI